jgi:HlyD family secretion protein
MKKKIFIPVIIIVILIACIYYFFFTDSKKAPQFVYSGISKGNISQTILSTGSLQAVTTVEVGTQVSGKITKLYVDFNSKVKKGQLLAVIDITNLKTQVNDARSNLEKTKVEYHQASVTNDKNTILFNKSYISELDYLTSQTNLEGALATQKTAQSSLDRAITNLGYAYIYAPISGIIQNRSVEEGQTVAASLSAPTLFTIAGDLNKMQILANIDESDIGQIEIGQKVDFSVQAYPDKKFWGLVVQKRINSAVVSNVVNYTVVCYAENQEKFLLPGMTATVDFYIVQKEAVLLVPNAALRFTPPDDMLAKFKSDMAKLNDGKPDTTIRKSQVSGNKSGRTKSLFGKIWYYDNNQQLRMASVVLGITDGKNTEIVRGKNIKDGMSIISGISDISTSNTAPKTNSLIPGGQQQGGRRGM